VGSSVAALSGSQGLGKVTVRPHLSDAPRSWPATVLVQAGARLQRQACSGVGGRPRPCRDPVTQADPNTGLRGGSIQRVNEGTSTQLR
jgi:hypothetical protein